MVSLPRCRPPATRSFGLWAVAALLATTAGCAAVAQPGDASVAADAPATAASDAPLAESAGRAGAAGATGGRPARGAPPPPANPLANLPFVGRFFGGGEEAASEDGTKVAPHYRLEVVAPEPVDRQIREFTLLGRWRQRPDYEPGQLPLFIRRAPEEVRGLLAAEGWFSPQVRVSAIEGGVRVEVDPGPRTQAGALELALAGGVAAPEAVALQERLRREWSLPAGAPFRSADWERAKRDLLALLRDGGYLRARIDDSEALVILDRQLAELRLSVDSGARLTYGAVEVSGLQRYPFDVVDGLRPFAPGDPFDGRDIFELQTRLNGAGWFTTVNVRPDMAALERDPSLTAVPIRVDVVERQAKRWTLGGGYDTDRGFNVLAGWEHRNVAGRGIQTFNGVEIDLERQLLFSTWETPQDVGGRRWQFGARAEHRDISNDVVDAFSVFASRNRRRGAIETAASLQYQAERQSIVFVPEGERLFENRALVAGWSWTQRKLDSPLFPSRGYIVSGQLAGASQSLGSSRSFTRAYGFGYAIVPLEFDDGSELGRLVVRGELGAVFADDRSGIPSANLFRTGGHRSVRGYASQSLGVPLGQATVGGRFLAVGSVEYQHPIGRDLSLAAFYDRGNAADSREALKTVAGWGVGVRWRTPVGPLNLDIAHGEATDQWRLHFSIGVVF